MLILAPVGVVLLLLWLYSLIEIACTPPARVRGIPKPGWVVLVAFLPIASIAWLAVGRPHAAPITDERWP